MAWVAQRCTSAPLLVTFVVKSGDSCCQRLLVTSPLVTSSSSWPPGLHVHGKGFCRLGVGVELHWFVPLQPSVLMEEYLSTDRGVSRQERYQGSVFSLTLPTHHFPSVSFQGRGGSYGNQRL